MNRVVSVEAFPPGDVIKRELDARGWKQDDLAKILGRTRQTVNRLIQGRTAITPEMAHELAAAFGTSAKLWMNLQTSYELSRAAKDGRDIKRRAEIYSVFPIRELVKRHWINETSSIEELESELCIFKGVDTVFDVPPIAVAAKKSDYSKTTEPQLLWFCKAFKQAQHVTAHKYDDSKFDDCIRKLRSLAAYPEDIERVPKVLAESGIRLVIVKHLKGTRIDGAAFWLDKHSPSIALSLRYDRIDNFWFTLFHELIHIKYRDESPVDEDVEKSLDGISDMESRANREAANLLVDKNKLDRFVMRTHPKYSADKVVRFAHARGVHPGIVVGQLHRRELDYKYLRRFLVSIRHRVVETALTEGWS